MKNNILFTCAGRRNYLINYFKEALNGKGLIIAADQNRYAPAMIDADVAIKMPHIYSDDYVDRLIQVISDHNINAVISLNDLELFTLARNKAKLEATGARVIISSEQVIDITFDKWKTAQFISDCGLSSPKTYISLKDAEKAIEDGVLQFPLVLKPRWGSASIAVDFADDMEELELVYKVQKIKLKNSILMPASEDFEHGILIQERIEGKEYGLDILNDFDGAYYGTFGREKLKMRSGETDIAISVIDDELNAIGTAISSRLKHIGNLDADVIKKKGIYYVLELNPRFGGGYPFSHEAGINTPAIYLEWLNGNTDVDAFNNYKDGILFAKCDRLIGPPELK